MMAFVFALVLLELLVVAWIDFKTHKISNNWSLLNISLGVVLYFTLGSLYPFSWEVLLFPLGFILIGFILFLMNIMGAGDSKFLASLFLLIPLEYHLLFFEKLVLSTIITGAFLLTYRIIRNSGKLKAYLISHYWEGVKLTLKSRFSYAPVIFMAWLILGLDIWR